MQDSHRRLPHRYGTEQPLFVTFRLDGSLPPGRAFPGESLNSGKAFVSMDRLLDEAQSGPTHLQIPAIAQLVVDAIIQGAVSDYLLHAWVIMPNHVHLLITPRVEVPHLLQKLKGTTARQANLHLHQTGTSFWQEDSYDHQVRNTEEFWRITNYIHQNPVRAGLASSPEEYPWSSAFVGQTSASARLQPRLSPSKNQ